MPMPACLRVRTVPDIGEPIGTIAARVPVLKVLEGKLDMMHDLHPELKSIASDLDDITDFSDMRAARHSGDYLKHMLNL